MTKATAKVKAKAPTPVRRMKTKDIDELVSRLETMDIGEDNEDVSEPVTPFRFFDLPYELRLRVYELLLVFPKTIDLDPSNSRAIVPYLRMLLTCRRMHDEASRVFYSLNTFRIFPIHGRFIHAKAPLLARLPSTYRAHITRLELRLGPSWTKPPRGWVVDSRLGLADATKVHFLKVFVECDPESNAYFEGFGGDGNDGSDGFYTMFCLGLMQQLFAQLEGLNKVEFDAYPGLPKTSPLLHSLVDAAKAGNKRFLWGPERGWDKIVEVDLANVLQKMGLGAL